MTLEELYQSVNTRLNKDQNGRTTNPDKLNAALQVANIKLFNSKAGLPEEYRPGQPLPRAAFDVTSHISEDLRFCRIQKGGQTQPITVNNGYAEIPNDFIKMGNLLYKYQKDGQIHVRPVVMCFDNEWGIIQSSPLRKPDFRNPKARLASGGKAFEILPKTVTKVDLTYYRIPKTPYFDWIAPEDVLTYLPPGGVHDGTGELDNGSISRSVELEWPTDTHTEILELVYEELSVSMRDSFTYQDAQQGKMTGK